MESRVEVRVARLPTPDRKSASQPVKTPYKPATTALPAWGKDMVAEMMARFKKRRGCGLVWTKQEERRARSMCPPHPVVGQ